MRMDEFMTLAIRFFIIIFAIYGLGCAGLYIFSRSLIYFPQPRVIIKNEIILTLPTAEGDVLVSTRPLSGNSAIVYLGGNAENVSLNLNDLSSAFPNYALYLLHYRGFGGSAGKPTEVALTSDALALFDKVYSTHKQVIIVGRSLGTGIAVQVANLRPAAKLILVTPYNSLLELANSQFPFMPVKWLLEDKYELWRYVPTINIPVLILAAEKDSVIPRDQTLLLHSHFKQNPVLFKILSNTSHNTISESPQYLPTIKSFVNSELIH